MFRDYLQWCSNTKGEGLKDANTNMWFEYDDDGDDNDDDGADGDENDDDIEPEQHGYGGVKGMQTKGGWTDLVINFHLKRSSSSNIIFQLPPQMIIIIKYYFSTSI